MASHHIYRAHIVSKISNNEYLATALTGPLIAKDVSVLFKGKPEEVLERDVIVRSNSPELGVMSHYITNEPKDFRRTKTSQALFMGMWYSPMVNSIDEILKIYYPGELTSVLFVTYNKGALETYEVAAKGVLPYKSSESQYHRSLITSFERYWKLFPGVDNKYLESARLILFSSTLNQAFIENPELYKIVRTTLRTQLKTEKSTRKFNLIMKPNCSSTYPSAH